MVTRVRSTSAAAVNKGHYCGNGGTEARKQGKMGKERVSERKVEDDHAKNSFPGGILSLRFRFRVGKADF